MKYFINQISNKDCGYACIKMILAKYHKSKHFLLDDKIIEDMSFLKMKKILFDNQIDTIGVKIEDNHYLTNADYSIIQIKEKGIKHFVVLEKVNKREVNILDPANGKRIIPRKYFFQIFTGYCLLIKKVNKISKNRKKLINIKSYQFIFLLSILIDFVIMYFLTFLANDTFNLLLTCLLASSILLNFLFKILIIFCSNHYIYKKIIFPYIKNNISLTNLETLINYRAELIQNSYKTISYIMMIIVSVFILLANSFWFIICILFAVFLFFIKFIIFDKTEKRILENSNILENNYSQNPVDVFKEINKNAHRLAFLKIMYYLIYVIFIVLFLIAYNEIFKINSLSFILFNTFFSFSLFEMMNKLIICLTKDKLKLMNLENQVLILLKNIKIIK